MFNDNQLEIFRRFLKYVFYILSKPRYCGDNPPFIALFIHLSFYKIVMILPDKLVETLSSLLSLYATKLDFIWSKTKYDKRYFIKLDTTYLYDISFKIPSNVEDYLVLMYGKNWRIPNENWNISKDKRE